MYTLGINAAFHDPAAALIRDGIVVAAAEEERFTRIKHGKRPIPFSAYELPFHAVDYCLKEAGIVLEDVEHIAYSYDPFLRLPQEVRKPRISLPLEPSAGPIDPEWEAPWDPLFLSSIVNAPRHLVGGVPHHLKKRFEVDFASVRSRWHFVDHHLCHSVSAFLPSPFTESAVITIDGRGEKATTTYGMGKGKELTLVGQVNMPHSLGMLYEQVTSHLGFLHSSDEYKVMALASYGSPGYLSDFRRAVQLQDNGQYTIDTSELWGALGPARTREEPITKRHADIAHSLQVAVEETVLRIAEWLRRMTGTENLCMAGGVALNCVLNSRIRDRSSFRRMWVQPAAGDAGTALGAALYIDMKERQGNRLFTMDHVYLGPEYRDDEVEHLLRECGLSFSRLENVASQTADILADGKIVGWFQGRMEFGPRALGARSILASPVDGETQTRLNMIKEREDFRPVAPAVIEEEAGRWFKTNGDSSPFMLFVHDVLPQKSHLIPAVCHIDNTARIQTVNRSQNPLYYDLLRAFQARTGIPILVNTSFNTRNHPIVCSPLNALESFWTSPIDVLVIGTYLVRKVKATDIKVSVIVPTCGRAELLGRCLAALSHQVFDRTMYEVIVVDDAVSEDARRVVEEFAGKGMVVRYIPVIGKHGPASARNLGLRLSRGEIIAFTDDDCIPQPDWLRMGASAFVDGIAGASGRLVVPLSDRPSDYEMNAARLESSQFVTANSFYRRPALIGIGGFDERFKAAWREDSDLFFRLLKAQKKLTQAPAAVVVHPVRPASWGVSVQQQKKNVFNALLYKKHPELYRQRLKPVFPWHYYFIVFALLLSIAGGSMGHETLCLGSFFAWIGGTSLFCIRRLKGSSHSFGHILEMIVTSAIIPPVCIFWRLVGAVKYRVFFI